MEIRLGFDLHNRLAEVIIILITILITLMIITQIIIKATIIIGTIIIMVMIREVGQDLMAVITEAVILYIFALILYKDYFIDIYLIYSINCN